MICQPPQTMPSTIKQFTTVKLPPEDDEPDWGGIEQDKQNQEACAAHNHDLPVVAGGPGAGSDAGDPNAVSTADAGSTALSQALPVAACDPIQDPLE